MKKPMLKLAALSVAVLTAIPTMFATVSLSADIDEDEPETVEVEGDEDSYDAEEVFREMHEPDYSASTNYYDSIGVPFPLETANDDLDQKRYEKVINDARQVLKTLPGDPFATYYFLSALAQSGNLNEVIDPAIEFYLDYPADKYANSFIRYLSMRLIPGFVERFKAAVTKAIATGDYDAGEKVLMWLAAGSVARDNGYLRDALEFTNLAENNNPDSLFVDYGKSLKTTIYIGMDQPEKAIDVLDSYPEDLRDFSWAVNNSIAIRNIKGVEAALPEVKENVDVYYYGGVQDTYLSMLVLGGHYDEAVAVADSLILDLQEFDPDSYYVDLFRVRRGVANLQAGKEAEARADFEQVRDTPESRSPYLIAQAYLGNREAAVVGAEAYFSNAYNVLASIYNILGETDKALELLGEAYSRNLWSPTATRYDVNQRSLVADPRFAEVAARFKP